MKIAGSGILNIAIYSHRLLINFKDLEEFIGEVFPDGWVHGAEIKCAVNKITKYEGKRYSLKRK